MNIHHVFAVYRNSDMTEGRGPMVLDSLWWTEDGAWGHADAQKGVMGRSPFRDHEELRKRWPRFEGECTGWSCKLCWGEFGGDWKVKKLEVH